MTDSLTKAKKTGGGGIFCQREKIKLQIINYKLQNRSYELQVASYEDYVILAEARINENVKTPFLAIPQ
jgi:hypothetical protein